MFGQLLILTELYFPRIFVSTHSPPSDRPAYLSWKQSFCYLQEGRGAFKVSHSQNETNYFPSTFQHKVKS
jgi:hypothetical protein